MSGPAGEMPFLDHLEELRWRILRSLGALVVGFGLGLWLVQRFQLVSVLKEPIAPFLQGGKLTVLSPTEPVLIVFKLGFIVGLVLASPVVIWQVWAFLSPALYEREKRALVPALFVGTALFITGAVLAYLFVIPQALRVLFSFQTEAVTPMITYDAYFGFVLQIVLALGLSFELPLIIVILAWLDVVTPAMLHRLRRFAVVGAFIAGAILSPGADLLSMIMMTVPLLLLYEIGVLGATVVHRRRVRQAATATLVLLAALGASTLGAGRAEAQVPVNKRPPVQADTGRAVPGDTSVRAGVKGAAAGRGVSPGTGLDSAAAQRLGLPTAPSRTFAEPDSVMRALLDRPGYDVTRFRSDTATVLSEDKSVRLEGEAMTERQGAILEADSIGYREDDCLLDASGDPRLFDQSQVLVGGSIRYDTCARRGIIKNALTNFQEGSTVWFLRGNVANDSASTRRIYAASSEITSCDLPLPHYHFSAREVKWVSQSVIVARPIVLYVADVPIMWLPFLFQDTRPGRHSGILIPQFGFSDIIRPSPGYNRQITNIGYYWAPNDYLDVTARLDWYANRYVQYGGTLQYNWLDRFTDGSLSLTRQDESGGGSSTGLQWSHNQRFNISTQLRLNLNYVTNTSIVDQNAVDPRLNTRQITSQANFTKRYNWGQISLGGNRTQSLSDSTVRTQFPALTVSPKPIDFGRNLTWSPDLSLTSDQASNLPANNLVITNLDGTVDTIAQVAGTRTTAFRLNTPFRIGSFNWQNSLTATDQRETRRDSIVVRQPDPSTPDPSDSVTVVRYFAGDFSTGVDWNTQFGLPTLFRSTWKIQPAVGVTNKLGGQPFALRNRNTFGGYVVQGKRFLLSATSSPTFFGFLPGVGPFSGIRHSVSPLLRWNYAPKATVSEEFARAVAGPGQPLVLESNAQHTVGLSLNQVFEAKGRPAKDDTLGAQSPNVRKYRLLSISTSEFAYDFEQEKLPGRTGWTTQRLTNSFLSDLLPGFNLSIAHDLWRGVVGTDTAQFDPFLQSVSASFSISDNTFRGIAGLLGLSDQPQTGRRTTEPERLPYIQDPSARGGPGQRFYNTDDVPLGFGRRGFTATFNYSLSRARPIPSLTPQPDQQSLNFSTAFSPTPLWAVAWQAQYNLTDSRFESQTVRLERDMHEWRAAFNFVRNANGNVALYFSIYLTDLPDLKFDYNRTTLED